MATLAVNASMRPEQCLAFGTRGSRTDSQVLRGDHQDVRRRLRLDVAEGGHLVVALDDLAGMSPWAMRQKMQSDMAAPDRSAVA